MTLVALASSHADRLCTEAARNPVMLDLRSSTVSGNPTASQALIFRGCPMEALALIADRHVTLLSWRGHRRGPEVGTRRQTARAPASPSPSCLTGRARPGRLASWSAHLAARPGRPHRRAGSRGGHYVTVYVEVEHLNQLASRGRSDLNLTHLGGYPVVAAFDPSVNGRS